MFPSGFGREVDVVDPLGAPVYRQRSFGCEQRAWPSDLNPDPILHRGKNGRPHSGRPCDEPIEDGVGHFGKFAPADGVGEFAAFGWNLHGSGGLQLGLAWRVAEAFVQGVGVKVL